MPIKIDKLYAFVITDEKGNEGIPAYIYGSMYYPCVASDQKRIDSFKEKLSFLPMFKNMTVKVVEFSTRNLIDEFTIMEN